MKKATKPKTKENGGIIQKSTNKTRVVMPLLVEEDIPLVIKNNKGETITTIANGESKVFSSIRRPIQIKRLPIIAHKISDTEAIVITRPQTRNAKYYYYFGIGGLVRNE